MSDISLSAGIRQNLLSLQNTAADLTTTQEALSTGKAVNSAADNPSAYFTSQTLTNTANSLSALLDQIGQGLQTINAATNGLTGLTSLLQQALSTAQQAQSASWTTAGSTTGTVDLSTGAPAGAAGNLLINVGSTTYTAAITSGESLTNIESAIGTATGGAITATDNGTDLILHLELSRVRLHCRCQCRIRGPRCDHECDHQQCGHRIERHAHHAARQL